jgi:hypothetical protein
MVEDAQSPSDAGAPLETPRRRTSAVPLVILLIVFIVGIVTLIRGSLRTDLNDAEIEAYLKPTASGRDAYHAAEQISRRIRAKDPEVKRFYPGVVGMSKSSQVENRKAAAWVMQYDNAEPTFHEALLALIDDPSPVVAWNAALSLSLHRSDAGRRHLRAMLQTYDVAAPAAGTFQPRKAATEQVRPDDQIGMLTAGNQEWIIHPPFPAKIESIRPADSAVKQGEVVATIRPSQDFAFSALVALTLPGIGRQDDIPVIEAYLAATPQADEKVADQAKVALSTLRALPESGPASRPQ